MLRLPLRLPTAIALAFTLLTAGHAQAQRQPPSPAESRTAYCISALSAMSKDAEIQASLPAPKLVQDRLREVLAGLDSDVKRMRGFLVPRMKGLDGEPLLAAADRGQADFDSLLKTETACKATCNVTPASAPDIPPQSAACFTSCAGKDPAVARVRSCRS